MFRVQGVGPGAQVLGPSTWGVVEMPHPFADILSWGPEL